MGYQSRCDNAAGNASHKCRLCGTCMPGYTRSSLGAACRKCPSEFINRIMMLVGILVLVIGCSVMIFLAINSETSDQETSDAVKKGTHRFWPKMVPFSNPLYFIPNLFFSTLPKLLISSQWYLISSNWYRWLQVYRSNGRRMWKSCLKDSLCSHQLDLICLSLIVNFQWWLLQMRFTWNKSFLHVSLWQFSSSAFLCGESYGFSRGVALLITARSGWISQESTITQCSL